MKLRTLHEAKTTTAIVKLSYVEVLDGFGVGTTRKYITSTNELEQLHRVYANEDRDDFVKKSNLSGAWGLYVIFEEQWKEMKSSIQKTGSWSTEFDDGGIGISAKGPKHAAQLANAEFVKAFASDDDDDEEDWY